MDTPEPEATQEVVEAPSVDTKSENAKGLRKQLDDAHKTIADMRTGLLDPAYVKLGLNPETGLGKAIAKEYDGAASYEALAEFAQTEYGHIAPEVEPDANPLAGQIHAESDKLEKVAGSAMSVTPPTQLDDLQKAEAEGDYATTMAIKGQQIADMMNRR